MFCLSKHFFSWLLVLMMIISPVQVSLAIDIDQHDHAPKCQMPMDADSSIGDSMNCAMQHDEHCQEHADCVGQFNSSSLQPPYSFLLTPGASKQLKFIIQNDTVLSVYPSLLKKPPKV